MNSTRNFRSRRSAVLLVALTSLSLFAANALRAQTSDIVAKLPASTVSYVEWRGSGALAATSQENHVIQLMEDPAMAPVWIGIAANFQKRQQESKAPAPPLSMPEVVSLLQNPAVFGIIELPRPRDVSPGGKAAPRIAAFMVYDATGKTDLIAKWRAATETRGQNPLTITHYDFDGTSVEVRSGKTGEGYSALAGKYLVASDRKRIVEQLITRFSSASAPANSITQRPEYAEVQTFVGPGGALEFFGRMPDVGELIPPNAKNQNGEKFIQNIHLDKVHAAGGSVSFAGPAMRVRAAILGNTQPPGPFDIAGASSETFETQSVAGGAPEFSVSRINLAAVYRLVYGALVPNLPPQQAASVSAMEGLAQGYLGMSIPDALDLFTGEMASTTSFEADGTQEQVFAASIQKPDALLRVLRVLLNSMTLAEEMNGNVTTLDIAVPYRDPATGLRRRKMYYVAVTPQLLVVAPRKALLREALHQPSPGGTAGAAAPKSAFVDPQFAELRARMPEKLSGLGYAEVAEVPWSPVFAKFASNAEQSAQAARRAAGASKTVHPPDFSWLGLVDPNVIPRHLHTVVSGWWKDSSGVYFDSYVQ